MLSSFIEAQNVEHKKLFFYYESRILAAVLIISPHDYAFQAPSSYTQYQGIALAPIHGKPHQVTTRQIKILSSLLDMLEDIYPYHSFCLHPSLSDLRPFQWHNYGNRDKARYSISLAYSGIIDLTQYSDYHVYCASIRSSRRQDYRKAIRSGLTRKESHDTDLFLELYTQTFLRQNILIEEVARDYVKAFLGKLLDANLVKLHMCYLEDSNPINAVVCIAHKDSSYYLFGATSPEYRELGGNTYLLLREIEDCYAANIKYFDMIGINSPARGDFKTSFNAVPVPYYVTTLGNG